MIEHRSRGPQRWKDPRNDPHCPADGKPMSAAQFLEALYGALPEFFKDEDELRGMWYVH